VIRSAPTRATLPLADSVSSGAPITDSQASLPHARRRWTW
jgi:hypothetical protein